MITIKRTALHSPSKMTMISRSSVASEKEEEKKSQNKTVKLEEIGREIGEETMEDMSD